VEAMWMMLQQEEPIDLVISTGETHSVRDFLQEACDLAGLDPEAIVKIHELCKRPNEVDYLCGDSTKAKTILGWAPKVKFRELVKIMINFELGRSPDPYEQIWDQNQQENS